MNKFTFMVFAMICFVVLLILCTVILQKYWAYSRIAKNKIKELSGERKLYENVYGSENSVYIVLNATTKIPRYVSGVSQKMMGIKRNDIMTDIHALSWVVPQRDISGFESEYAKWDKKSKFEREFEFVHLESGSRCVGKVSINYNAQDDTLFILINDITMESEEKKKLHNELEQIKNLNKYRNEFLSNISHEIRTPITSMQGQLQLARMNAANPAEVRRYTAGVSEQTDKLLSILNDMFDISRIESGNIVLENNEFDIMAIAQKLKDTYEPAATAMNKAFELEMTDFNVRYFMGDELRVQQILIAFIANAQEVTPAGGKISLSIRQMNKAEHTANFLFRVRDEGPRMSQQEAMKKLEAGGSNNIAMAMAGQLVSLLGGQIMFNSDNDGNSYSIFITFNLSDRVQDLTAEIDRADDLINKDFTFEGCRILLAEDNETNAEIAKELLEMMGAEVDVAENGKIAVDKFMTGGQGRYHVILMDIQMPEMDGLEATRKIRSLYGAEAKTIPIFALSANAFVEDKNRSLEAGMNGHIAKPIDFDVLKSELAKYL